MISDAVNMLVIQSIDQVHLGFTLFNPDLSHPTGDCVFMIIPHDPEVLESEEVALLLNIKDAGEYHWSKNDSELLITQKSEPILKFGEDGLIEYLPTNSPLARWVAHTPKQ